MRIVYLHQYFNTPEMIGGTRSFEMARRLASAGHEVEIITSWRSETIKKGWFVTNEESIKVHWLPVTYSNNMGYGKRILAFFQFAFASSSKAASIPGDVVFATSTPLTICIPGIWASWVRRIPMVFEVRDLWPEIPIAMGALKNPIAKWLARKMEQLAYKNSARIVALSSGMAEGVMRSGYPAEKITVIPNSCDLELFDFQKSDPREFLQAHPELESRRIVMYTGTLGAINGVDYLVSVAHAALLIDPRMAFVVVGNGSEESSIKSKAKDLGVLNENLFIYDSVPKCSMPSVMAAADVLLSLVINLEVLWGNSANKFFDALAAGKPIAINYGGWQAALIEETGTGLLLPAGSPERAAETLIAHVGNKEWIQNTGRKGLQLARDRFSRDVLAGQLEDVLKSAVATHSYGLAEGREGKAHSSARGIHEI